mmetsp:Transcript_14249/g.40509  ORF Transcript_14249/g.40509 Transcript_14249/m.40509 type:complete len:200 (-) Transcript_14249:861-1460(-)
MIGVNIDPCTCGTLQLSNGGTPAADDRKTLALRSQLQKKVLAVPTLQRIPYPIADHFDGSLISTDPHRRSCTVERCNSTLALQPHELSVIFPGNPVHRFWRQVHYITLARKVVAQHLDQFGLRLSHLLWATLNIGSIRAFDDLNMCACFLHEESEVALQVREVVWRHAGDKPRHQRNECCAFALIAALNDCLGLLDGTG